MSSICSYHIRQINRVGLIVNGNFLSQLQNKKNEDEHIDESMLEGIKLGNWNAMITYNAHNIWAHWAFLNNDLSNSFGLLFQYPCLSIGADVALTSSPPF